MPYDGCENSLFIVLVADHNDDAAADDEATDILGVSQKLITLVNTKLAAKWMFTLKYGTIAGWWLHPLWKIWKSVVIIVPNLWENKIHVPNHQPDRFWSSPTWRWWTWCAPNSLVSQGTRLRNRRALFPRSIRKEKHLEASCTDRKWWLENPQTQLEASSWENQLNDGFPCASYDISLWTPMNQRRIAQVCRSIDTAQEKLQARRRGNHRWRWSLEVAHAVMDTEHQNIPTVRRCKWYEHVFLLGYIYIYIYIS